MSPTKPTGAVLIVKKVNSPLQIADKAIIVKPIFFQARSMNAPKMFTIGNSPEITENIT